MLFHAFLSGMGIALSYTVITSLIVQTHNVHHLPVLYVITAILLLLSGYIYSKLEHRLQPAVLFKAVLIVLSLWGIAMSINLRFAHDLLVIAVAFCSYYLVYYLSNLEYWGSASLLFDVRQGKRLFGLLSVGESIAKIMGYAITPLIIVLVDVSGVFMIVALSFGGAFLLFSKLTKEYHSSMVLAHHKTHDEDKSGTVITQMTLQKIFKGDKFKFFISIFALISSLSLFLIQYAFLARVEERFYDLEHIAVFIATLLSIAKFLNLSIKVFLSARLFQLVGLKTVLLLLPVTLLVISITGVFGIFTGNASEDYIIWVFTLVFLADEVLRTSLYTPAYLTLFQPLTKAKRLEGHTLTKGIMEPIGIGIAGALLYFLMETQLFNLQSMSYIIVFWLFAWILSGLELYKSYLDILKNALKTKLLNRGTLKLNKEEVRILKEEKLTSPDPVEKLYALQMLGDRLTVEEIHKPVRKLLASKNQFILGSVLDYFSKHDFQGLEPELKKLIFHENKSIARKAIKEYCRSEKDRCIEVFMEIFDTLDRVRRNVVIASAIRYGGLSGAIEFGRNLLEMIESEDPDERASAAKIIGEIDNKSYYQPLLKLLTDPSEVVIREAIIAAGKLGNEALIDPLLDAAQTKKHFLYCVKSFAQFGPQVAKRVRSHMKTTGPAGDILFIKLISSNNEEATIHLYEECLDHKNFDVRRATVSALFKRSYKVSQPAEMVLNKLIDKLIASITSLTHYLQKVNNVRCREIIYNEIYHIKLYMVYQCLAFKYPRKAITDIIKNSYNKEGEFRSIAQELLENTLTSGDARKIIPVIDKVLELNPEQIAEYETDATEEIYRKVIADANKNYHSWFVANALRYAGEHLQDFSIPKKLLVSDIVLIRQEVEKLSFTKTTM